MSNSSSKSRSVLRSRPWAHERGNSNSSRDSLALESGILTQKSRHGSSNRDLMAVKGFSKFTRPVSRGAETMSNSLGKLELTN